MICFYAEDRKIFGQMERLFVVSLSHQTAKPNKDKVMSCYVIYSEAYQIALQSPLSGMFMLKGMRRIWFHMITYR